MSKFLIRPATILTIYFILTIFLGYVLLDFSFKNSTLNIEFSKFESNFIDENLNKSFLLYLTAFICFVAGIFLFPKKLSKITNSISLFFTKEKAVTTISLIIVTFYGIAGSTGIVYTLLKVGIIPLFDPDPLSAKHFLNVIDKFVLYRPLYLISYMALMTSSTILIYFFIKASHKKRIFIALLIFFQLFILLLIMKRALVLGPLLSISIAYVLVGKSGVRGLLISFVCIIIIGTSMEYIGKAKVTSEQTKAPLQTESQTESQTELDLQDFIQRVSNNFFVEPRELTRVLVAWESKKLNFIYGKSYIASFLGFLPSSFSEFKSKYNIGRFTLATLGYNPARGAIPRIGYVGEAYLNFGWVGVIFISFIFGSIIKLIDNLYMSLRDKHQDTLWGMLLLWLICVKPSLGFFGSGTSEFAFAGFILILLCPLIIENERASMSRNCHFRKANTSVQ